MDSLAQRSRAFRWQDQPLDGYAPKVFDVTPVSYEPVMNSFRLVADVSSL